MRGWVSFSATALLCAFATQAFAFDPQITDAWVRQSLRGEKVTSAFVTLRADEDAAIVAASSNVSKSALLAQVQRHPSGFVTNKILRQIPVTSDEVNVLANQGYHIMLMNLKPSGVHAGQTVQIRLKIKSKEGEIVEREFNAPVRGLIAR